MMESLSFLLGILILMVCSAFFSGVEVAFISVNKYRLRHLVELQNKPAKLVQSLQEKPEEVLTTILIGNNLSNIGATALFTLWIYPLWPQYAEWISVLVMMPIVLIFAEIIPKIVFRHQANHLIFILIGPLLFFFRIFRPFAQILSTSIQHLPFMKTTSRHAGKFPFVNREELYQLIQEGQKEGLLEPHELRMMERIMEFGMTSVKEVMTRKIHIVSINQEETVAEAKELFRKTGYSRIPIRGTGNMGYTGVLYVKDCLFEEESRRVRDMMRDVISLQENTVIEKAFIELRIKKQRMAIVKNSDNQLVGIVTIHDLLSVS
jgi:putative hemolysin